MVVFRLPKSIRTSLSKAFDEDLVWGRCTVPIRVRLST